MFEESIKKLFSRLPHLKKIYSIFKALLKLYQKTNIFSLSDNFCLEKIIFRYFSFIFYSILQRLFLLSISV